MSGKITHIYNVCTYRKYMHFKVIIYPLKIGDEYNWCVYDIIGINPYKQKIVLVEIRAPQTPRLMYSNANVYALYSFIINGIRIVDCIYRLPIHNAIIVGSTYLL